jgi:PAS domain S-box-containing protein
MSGDGLIRDWNPAAEKLFGYTHADAVGRELAELIIPHALRERHRLALARFVESGQPTIIGRRLELFAQRANGKLLPVELTVTVMPDHDPVMFAGFVRNQSTA